MARTKKTVRFDGRVTGIKVTVDSDRYGVAAKAKKKIIDAAWKKVDAAAKAAAAASTEYGRQLIGTDPRRVDTGYMRDTFSVDASKGGKVVEIGWHKWEREKPYYSWQENGTYGNRTSGYLRSGLRGKARGGKDMKGIVPAKYLPRITAVFREEFYGRLK